jgi:hypothetical protein
MITYSRVMETLTGLEIYDLAHLFIDILLSHLEVLLLGEVQHCCYTYDGMRN